MRGNTVNMTLTPSRPIDCPFNFTATVNGNQMTGTGTAFNCTVPIAFAVNLTKQ